MSLVCPACNGTGEKLHAGYSLSPFSSTWVRDPQETVSEDCPQCFGSGELEGATVIVFGRRQGEERDAA